MSYRLLYDQLTDGKKRKVINHFTSEFNVCVKTFFNKVNSPLIDLNPVEKTFFINNIEKKETITNDQFREELKTWINHKVKLSENSDWYKHNNRKDSIYYLKTKFSSFLNFHKQYNIGQLAIDVKRNQALFENVLPIPNNNSYENSVTAMLLLIEKANDLVKELRLESII